jgi:hypothetical protein
LFAVKIVIPLFPDRKLCFIKIYKKFRMVLTQTRQGGSWMDQKPDDASIGFSGEFLSKIMEAGYLRFNWADTSRIARHTLLVIAFMGLSFFAVDVLSAPSHEALYRLLALRLITAGILVGIAEYVRRRNSYFATYPYLLLFVQIVIALAIFGLAVLRQMPSVYVGVNTILFTLIYYQFLSNRLDCTVIACLFFGFGAIMVSSAYLNLPLTEFIGAFLFLIPLNFLGVTILCSLNRTRRGAYLALIKSQRHNTEKERLIQDLQAALGEVKTLQGFIPICAHCHKIRNDKGFWERIEKYIQDRTKAQFSHSLCPDCAKGIYSGVVKER